MKKILLVFAFLVFMFFLPSQTFAQESRVNAVVHLDPGTSVVLDPLDRTTVMCRLSDPTAKKCIVEQKCVNPEWRWAVVFIDSHQIVDNTCYERREQAVNAWKDLRQMAVCQ